MAGRTWSPAPAEDTAKYIPTWKVPRRIPHWTLAEDPRHPEIEKAPRQYQDEAKEKKESGWDLHPEEEAGKEESPPPWGAPSRAGTLAGTEGSLGGSGESQRPVVAAEQKRVMPPHCGLQSGTCCC